ncbi:hypothetical protein EVAR_57054_1 [Eumeta japonica]|uniref:Uncharacterized protein n=1 Tax=Eumeta variegata TaxID=151549 RepID=A0A4C1YSP6_EUMVA|nr:hypothetical protein EVAR_57054_1 [Eumeta japonica]
MDEKSNLSDTFVAEDAEGSEQKVSIMLNGEESELYFVNCTSTKVARDRPYRSAFLPYAPRCIYQLVSAIDLVPEFSDAKNVHWIIL